MFLEVDAFTQAICGYQNTFLGLPDRFDALFSLVVVELTGYGFDDDAWICFFQRGFQYFCQVIGRVDVTAEDDRLVTAVERCV